MAAEKLPPRNRLTRYIDDLALRAPHVRHQRARLEQRIDVPNRVENAPDGLRQKNQIGGRHRLFQSRSAIDRAARHRIGQRTLGADADNGAVESGLPQRQSKRRPDQAGADNRYRLQTLLPTAAAMSFNCSINSPNCSGRSDCAPSLRARSGSG